LPADCLADGRLDIYGFKWKVAGNLVRHEHGYLSHQIAEVLGSGILVPYQRYLMLDQRMVYYMNLSRS